MLLSLIEKKYSLVPTSQGQYLIHCPFHKDNNPSCRVDDKRYKCFVCGAGGDAVDWLSKLEGMSVRDALLLVKKEGPKPKAKETKSNVFYPTKDDLNLLNKFTNLSNKFLLSGKNKEALEYIQSRLTEDEIKRFKIGLCPPMSEKTEKELAPYIDVGLVGVGKKYLLHNNRIIIPKSNQSGNTISIASRSIGTQQPHLPKYINGATTAFFQNSKYLYNINNASGQEYIMLCEGFFDVIKASSHVTNICPVGVMTSSISIYQAIIISNLNKKVIICLDNDDAGIKGMIKSAEILFKNGINSVTLRWIEGVKDLYDMYVNNKTFRESMYMNDEKGNIVVGQGRFKNQDILFNLAKQAVDKNISDGFPHLNHLEYCVSLYDELGKNLFDARKLMLSNALADNMLREDDVKNVVKAWIKICKKVREDHE